MKHKEQDAPWLSKLNELTSTSLTRREFLKTMLRGVFLLGLGSLGLLSFRRTRTQAAGWQINPQECIQCGECAKQCVRSPSAVRVFHHYENCGYCKLCFGYFRPGTQNLHEGAENQICPTGAIRRSFIEDPYFQYDIIRELCIGCGRCVKGCRAFGNGSLYLQIDRSLCLNCNECNIAKVCPTQAIHRIPLSKGYLENLGIS